MYSNLTEIDLETRPISINQIEEPDAITVRNLYFIIGFICACCILIVIFLLLDFYHTFC
jgi:hypothetical protein